MPDRQGQFPSWLEYPQHLSNSVNRRWKKHHSEAADHGIEGIGGERQTGGRGDVEFCIPEPKMGFRPPSGADQGSYGQCWLARTRSNIQNCVPAANQPILDKSLRDRRKHLPNDFAMLLPERRGITPSAYNLLVGLHQQKYTYRAG